jgi:hypothetical protein
MRIFCVAAAIGMASAVIGPGAPAKAVSGTYTVYPASLPAPTSMTELVFTKAAGCDSNSPLVKNPLSPYADSLIIPLSTADANHAILLTWTTLSPAADTYGFPRVTVYNSSCQMVTASTAKTGPTSATTQLPSNGAWLLLGNNYMANVTYTLRTL